MIPPSSILIHVWLALRRAQEVARRAKSCFCMHRAIHGQSSSGPPTALVAPAAGFCRNSPLRELKGSSPTQLRNASALEGPKTEGRACLRVGNKALAPSAIARCSLPNPPKHALGLDSGDWRPRPDAPVIRNSPVPSALPPPVHVQTQPARARGMQTKGGFERRPGVFGLPFLVWRLRL